MAKRTTVSPSSVVAQRPGQVAETIDEVTAIMSVDRGVYFLLDATGSEVWTRIATPIRVSDLCAQLVAEFDVDPKTCERDVLEFLDDVVTRQLAHVVG